MMSGSKPILKTDEHTRPEWNYYTTVIANFPAWAWAAQDFVSKNQKEGPNQKHQDRPKRSLERRSKRRTKLGERSR